MVGARMLADERRQQLVEASIGVFARAGFHGATTRAIADAAGVSEALLYRHFPSKEELFAEVQKYCLSGAQRTAERLAEQRPSTRLLVLEVSFMLREIIGDGRSRAITDHIRRLCLSSLIEDGRFMRELNESNLVRWVPVMAESLRAAALAGDTEGPVPSAEVSIWLAHHLGVMVANLRLPEARVVDYGCSDDELFEAVVRFALRGLGLKPEAIDRHLDLPNLDRRIESLLADGATAGDSAVDASSRPELARTPESRIRQRARKQSPRQKQARAPERGVLPARGQRARSKK